MIDLISVIIVLPGVSTEHVEETFLYLCSLTIKSTLISIIHRAGTGTQFLYIPSVP